MQLVVQSGAEPGRTYDLDAGNKLSVGRQSSNQIVVSDEQVSRRHAEIQLEPDGVVVTDLNSSNGTFVNGTRISSVIILKPGDTLQVGTTVLKLVDNAAATRTWSSDYEPNDATLQAKDFGAAAYSAGNGSVPPPPPASSPSPYASNNGPKSGGYDAVPSQESPYSSQPSPSASSTYDASSAYGQPEQAAPAYGQPAYSQPEQAQPSPYAPPQAQSQSQSNPYAQPNSGQSEPPSPYSNQPSYGQGQAEQAYNGGNQPNYGQPGQAPAYGQPSYGPQNQAGSQFQPAYGQQPGQANAPYMSPSYGGQPGQPGAYPQQPAYAQPKPATAKKKGNNLLIIGLVAGLAALLVIVLLVVFLGNSGGDLPAPANSAKIDLTSAEQNDVAKSFKNTRYTYYTSKDDLTSIENYYKDKMKAKGYTLDNRSSPGLLLFINGNKAALVYFAKLDKTSITQLEGLAATFKGKLTEGDSLVGLAEGKTSDITTS